MTVKETMNTTMLLPVHLPVLLPVLIQMQERGRQVAFGWCDLGQQ